MNKKNDAVYFSPEFLAMLKKQIPVSPFMGAIIADPIAVDLRRRIEFIKASAKDGMFNFSKWEKAK